MTADEILQKYGFYQTGAGVGGGDVLGASAVQRATTELQANGFPVPHFLNAVESQQVKDPNGPGNGEGGSDLGNIFKLGSMVVGGGMGLESLMGSGMFSGLGAAGDGVSMGTQSLSQPYQTAVGGWNSQAGGGMDWIDELIQQAQQGGFDPFTSTTADPSTWLPGAGDGGSSSMPWFDNSGTFQNADGSWGSTAANSGAGGSGAYPGYGGNDLSFLGGSGNGIADIIKKALGLGGGGQAGGAANRSPLASILGLGSGGDDWMKLLGQLGGSGLGAYGASQQGDQLKALAEQMTQQENARYTDQRDIANSRYAEQNAINQERYGYAQQQAEAATARGIDTQNYAKGVVAPSQARYEGSFAPGFTMSNDPGFMDALNQSSKATLHGLSVQGNPGDSPNAWAASLKDNYEKVAYPALKDYRSQNAATGFGGPYAQASVNTPGYIPVNSQTAGFGQLTGMGNPTAGATTAAAAIGSKGNVLNSIGQGVSAITNPQMTLSDWIQQNKNNGSSIFGGK